MDNLVAVFREVRRVLSDQGTLWLNVGDGYARNRRSWICYDLCICPMLVLALRTALFVLKNEDRRSG